MSRDRNIDAVILDHLLKYESKQDEMARDIADIRITLANELTTAKLKISDELGKLSKRIDSLPCKVHKEKVGRLEKVVYGTVAFLILAYLAAVLDFRSVKASAEQAKQKPPAQVQTHKIKK